MFKAHAAISLSPQPAEKSNIFFGLSIVFYNTYLPLLVRNHPDYINIETNQEKYLINAI